MKCGFIALVVSGTLFGSGLGQEDAVLYLLGKAEMADQTRVPRFLNFELACDGHVVRQVSAGASGTFSFDLGSLESKQSVTDVRTNPTTGGLDKSFARNAWNPSGFNTVLGKVYLDACEVRLSPHPGYSADPIKLGIRDLQDRPDIGILEIERVGERVADTVWLSTAAAPREALKPFEESRAILEGPRPDLKKAEELLEKAVKAYPALAEAWSLLGDVRMSRGDSKGARDAFKKASGAEAQFPNPLIGLCQIEIEEQNWQRAFELARAILRLNEKSPKGLLFGGISAYYLGRPERAMRLLSRLESLGYSRAFPISLLHLGMLYGRMGDVGEAARRLRDYLTYSESSQVPEERRRQIEAQLEAWGEQGPSLLEAGTNQP